MTIAGSFSYEHVDFVSQYKQLVQVSQWEDDFQNASIGMNKL